MDFLTLSANDSAGNKQDYAKIGAIVESATSDSEDGALVFQTSLNSVLTERLRITSGGKVGISTTNAIMPLTIKGDVSRNAIAIFNSGSGTEEGILYWYSSDETTIRAGISGNENGLDFKTGSSATNRMRLDSSGDLTMKGGRIIVRESDDGNDAVKITRDADEGYVQLFSSGSQTVELRGNGASYFNGGNVGIGTTSPSRKLTVQGTGDSYIAAISFTNK